MLMWEIILHLIGSNKDPTLCWIIWIRGYSFMGNFLGLPGVTAIGSADPDFRSSSPQNSEKP